MKKNRIVYRIRVYKLPEDAVLHCIIYSDTIHNRYFDAEFRVVQNSFSNIPISKPEARLTTFQDELRRGGQTRLIQDGYPQDIEKWIENKMKEAYGDNLTIRIEELQA